MIALLEARFVPVALDCVYWERRDDESGRFFRKLAEEADLNRPNEDGGKSNQGHYVAAASGALLAAHNRRGPEAALALMEKALAAVAVPGGGGGEPPGVPDGPEDARFVRRLPEGGLALDVHTRITRIDESLQVDESDFQKAQMRFNRERAGFDHLWLGPDDVAALAPGDRAAGERWAAPRRVALRLSRFHLTDNVRGEPPHFERRDVKEARLDLEVARVEGDLVEVAVRGAFEAERTEGRWPCGFRGAVEGSLAFDRAKGAFVRFDLLAEGTFRGEGRWTPGAPRGPFGLAVAFELPRSRFALGIPPQGMRDARAYLNP